MNAASLDRSRRLQRALSALRRHRKGLTTMQMIKVAGVCAVNSVVAELRANGQAIACRAERARGGGRVYRYVLQAA